MKVLLKEPWVNLECGYAQPSLYFFLFSAYMKTYVCVINSQLQKSKPKTLMKSKQAVIGSFFQINKCLPRLKSVLPETTVRLEAVSVLFALKKQLMWGWLVLMLKNLSKHFQIPCSPWITRAYQAASVASADWILID